MDSTHSNSNDSLLDDELQQIVESAITQAQAGEHVDVESLAAAHPQYAAELRELLDAALMMVEWGRGESQPPRTNGDSEPDLASAEPLGDFQIVREIGRGGMGVVYEAVQLSLGRRVALKVLPLAAMLDKQHLARFQNEARAAATLHHPNIVPVFAVGCDRGVHYYAMQLIEGRSLAQLIQHLRREDRPSVDKGLVHEVAMQQAANSAAAISTVPDFNTRDYYRAAARIIADAAAALDYAHLRGVLHRDIKPGNLLLDEWGRVWVADFGLAHFGDETRLTTTGDLVGTFRYMSPEQALGRRGVVDHRADVYSLGATLYELITLEPVYGQVDREVLFRSMATRDAPRLRRVKPKAPVDLETIVAKALEKEPAARYATAGELADDLRRFLAEQTIKAKPATLAQRAVKQARRHMALTATIALAVVALGALGAGSAWLLAHERRNAELAREESQEFLYTTAMQEAFADWQQGGHDDVRSILDQLVPASGATDYRGLEWHLLDSLVRSSAVAEFAGHRGTVRELVVLPNQRLATVGDDGTLRIWSLAMHECLETVPLSQEPLYAIAVSPDGKTIAAGGRESALYLCDVDRKYRVRKVFENGPTSIESIAFHPGGEQLAVGFRYERLSVLSKDGTLLREIPCESRIESVEYTHDGDSLLAPNRISVGANQAEVAELWASDLSRKMNDFYGVARGQPAEITVARVAPSGLHLVLGDRRRSRVVVLDRASGAVLAGTPREQDPLQDVAVAPDGRTVAAAFQSGVIKLWHVELALHSAIISETPRLIKAHRGEAIGVKFLNSRKLVSCGGDGSVRLWNIETVSMPERWTDAGGWDGPMIMPWHDRALRQPARAIRFSPDSSHILYMGDQEVFVCEPTSGAVVQRKSMNRPSTGGACWCPSGGRLALCSGNNAYVEVVEFTGGALYRIVTAVPPIAAAFSPAEDRIAAIAEQQLHICRADDGVAEHELKLPGLGSALQFSPAGDTLAVGGEFGVVLFDPKSGRELRQLGGGWKTTQVSFSTDGATLAVGYDDGMIRMWAVDSGDLMSELVGHESSVCDVQFSDDGRTLASTSLDNTVRLWSARYGKQLGSLYGPFNSTLHDYRVCLSAKRFALSCRQDDGNSQLYLWRRRDAAE